jgi:NTE family protein
MAKNEARASKHAKSLNIALQGGGSHGTFTWGVLDKIFEDGRIWIDAISGTSAGAMNAVVAAQGMYEGGGAGARSELERFWRAVSRFGESSVIRRNPIDKLQGNWSLDNSPGYIWLDLMNRLASPYDTNPLGINRLRTLVEEFVDFRKVRDCADMPIFISATNVETGRVRIFQRDEVSLDVVMASACLPSVFPAVEIDGIPFWDGGYMGNPVERKGTPSTARDIQNRVNEITFNASLLKELRMIELVDRLIDTGRLTGSEFRRMNVHVAEYDAKRTLNTTQAGQQYDEAGQLVTNAS